MPQLTKMSSNRRKVILWGDPKGGGKSTFALTAQQPLLLLNYDQGNPGAPPFVDPEGIYVQNYPSTVGVMKDNSDQWDAPSLMGAAIIRDLQEVRDAILANRDVRLVDPVTGDIMVVPCPSTIVLDGLVAMSIAITDWLLAVNKVRGPEDFGDPRQFWGKRLNRLNYLFNTIVPLPVNVILVTWSTNEMKEVTGSNGKPTQVPTGRIIPDIGGKLDIWTPGKVDASLYCYNVPIGDGVKYYVQTKPDAKVPAVGVRGRYDLSGKIDVTIPTVKTPNYLSPWEKVWGAMKLEEKKVVDLSTALGGKKAA